MSKQKTRFDGLDVLSMTSQLQNQLLGFKVVNIYDGSSGNNVLLFKLASTGTTAAAASNHHHLPNASSISSSSSSNPSSANHNKKMLLMESGIRFHITAHESNNQQQPGQFAMKLRKHIRGSRLEGVRQLGSLDRVVDFRFGSGDRAHHVILELYASGNIILTDSKYEILALLRTHDYDVSKQQKEESKLNGDRNNQRVRVAVREIYPVTYATSMSTERNDGKNDADLNKNVTVQEMNVESFRQWMKSEIELHEKFIVSQQSHQSKKKKKIDKSVLTLKTLILKQSSGVHYYGPSLIEHCILCASLNPSHPLTMVQSIDNTEIENLIETIKREATDKLHSLRSGTETGGYILYKPKDIQPNDVSSSQSLQHPDKVFCEFQPHLLKQHQGFPNITYKSFSEAVDEFFSLIEGQKLMQKVEAVEKSAKDRLDKIRQDQEKRVEGLVKEQEKMQQQAKLIELYASDVDNALLVINSALDSGMDWDDLEKLVEFERNVNKNPIAMIINNIDFKNNMITLTLTDPDTEDDAGFMKSLDVTVSRLLSAHANAREMFARHRNAKEKADKTVEASLNALKLAEIAALKQIQESQIKREKITSFPARKVFWFEKFNWFITSDNYLVIGGRDAQQNEVIVKRYLRPGDAYLHADVHGASSCILRAKRRRNSNGETQVLPLPDSALREAGTFTICRSSAWSSKMVTSAWWVNSHQVSKTAPTGEYLTVGSFMIRGRKNFLPPSHLEMGLAVLFRLGDEASIVRHANDRRDFSLIGPSENDKLEGDEEFFKEIQTIQRKSNADIGSMFSSIKLESSKPPNLNEGENQHEIIVDNDRDAFVNQDSCVLGIEDIKGGKKHEDMKLAEISDENTFEIEDKSNVDSLKPRQKKGLSTRDRKLIKKYGSLEAAEEAAAQREEEDLEHQKLKELKIAAKEASLEESKPDKSVRGKKGKKKRATKYADQDEDDRELALFALQGRNNKKKSNRGKGSQIIKPKSQTQVEAASAATALLVKKVEDIVEKLDSEVRNILGRCVEVKVIDDDDNAKTVVNWTKFDGEILEQLLSLSPLDAQVAAANRLHQLTKTTRIDNFAASLAGIIRKIKMYGYENLCDDASTPSVEGKQRKTKAEKEAEKEAWQALLAEDGVIEGDADDDLEKAPDDTPELLKLTGKPMNEDNIHFAIPVCAPYQSLSQYKYRIKLTPGSQKRGKASKQCLDMFLTSAKDTHVERDFIKLITDNEWVQTIVGEVKISAPGASKITKKNKHSNKKGLT